MQKVPKISLFFLSTSQKTHILTHTQYTLFILKSKLFPCICVHFGAGVYILILSMCTPKNADISDFFGCCVHCVHGFLLVKMHLRMV